MILYEVTKAFQKEKIPFAVVGGLALALHGIVRATIDLDLVMSLTLEQLTKAEKALIELGLQSRIPVRAKDIANFRQEYIENRNLIAWSFVDASAPLRQVDLLIHRDLNDIETEIVKVGGMKIPVATLAALAVMKKEAGRPQDLVDLERIHEKIKKTNPS